MKKNDFYIGWAKGMPERSSVALKTMIFGVVSLAFVVLFLVVYFQKPFNDHFFSLGKQSEMTGVYIAQPVPMLYDRSSQEGTLLVGYGKFGAQGIMQEMMEKQGNLNGQLISLNGTIISGDGKNLLELTDRVGAFVGKEKGDFKVKEIDFKNAQPFKAMGEILDPKCYFGVMKPGEGKIHKSCAIRCISGGIPPVFRSGVPGNYVYHIMIGKDGGQINADILDYVADPIHLEGNSVYAHGWNYLFLDPSDIQRSSLK